MAIHDCPNNGYKIIIKENNYKIFHISDTKELNHLIVKDYNLYCLEANYETDDELYKIIKEEKEKYGFSYRERVLQTHTSMIDAINWLDRNNTNGGDYIFIHQHKEGNNEN
jgi:hypothetical protein